MVYIVPQDQTLGTLIGPARWNQDVVANAIAIHSLAAFAFLLALLGGNR